MHEWGKVYNGAFNSYGNIVLGNKGIQGGKQPTKTQHEVVSDLQSNS